MKTWPYLAAGPIVAVLERAGWRSAMATEVTVALVMVAIGLSAIPVVAVAALTGRRS